MFKLHFHIISILKPCGRLEERSHATWGARHDHSSLAQCGASTQMLDQGRYAKDKVIRLARLSLFAVDQRAESQLGRIGNEGGRRDDGSNRGELVERLSGPRLVARSLGHLPPPGRHVVAYRVAQDIGSHVFRLGDVFAVLSEDNAEFDL